MKKLTAIFVSLLLSGIITTNVWAQIQYNVTDLGPQVSAAGINDSGQVVGSYITNNQGHAFLYTGGVISDIGTLTGENGSSGARDINNKGQIVGLSTTWSNDQHSFLYSDNVMTDLDLLSGKHYSEPKRINDNGDVVGYYKTAQNTITILHAYLYSGGTVNEINSLGGNEAVAFGINNNGQVVGYTTTQEGPYRAFIYDNNTMTALDTSSTEIAVGINSSGQILLSPHWMLGGAHSYLDDGGVLSDLGYLGGNATFGNNINDKGQIVGWAYTTNGGGQHAFIYENGIIKDLNTLIDPVLRSPDAGEMLLENACDINSSGQIVVNGIYNNEQHAFLLTPIPEPSTIILLCGGVLALSTFRLWRKRV